MDTIVITMHHRYWNYVYQLTYHKSATDSVKSLLFCLNQHVPFLERGPHFVDIYINKP